MTTNDLSERDEEFAQHEEELAAEEAAAIGGPGPEYEGDEAERPLEEGGEGVAEGFEQSEDELIEAASHGEQRYNPAVDEFTPEEAADESTAVYGEPDEIDPTEVVSDPDEEADEDPGEGPGITSER